jgi:hypothetical protein
MADRKKDFDHGLQLSPNGNSVHIIAAVDGYLEMG